MVRAFERRYVPVLPAVPVSWLLTNVLAGTPVPLTALHAANQGGHTYTVAYRPDGRFLASASDDGTVKIWKMRD